MQPYNYLTVFDKVSTLYKILAGIVIVGATVGTFFFYNASNFSTRSTQVDIYAGWRTYTTNNHMDLDDAMYKSQSNLNVPTLTFRYPPTWKVDKSNNNYPSEYLGSPKSVYNGYSSSLMFFLVKGKSQLTFWFGVLPDGANVFDYKYWGFTSRPTITPDATINGVRISQDTWQDVSGNNFGTVFHLTSSNKLYVVANPGCDEALCSTLTSNFKSEVNQILSSFKFVY